MNQDFLREAIRLSLEKPAACSKSDALGAILVSVCFEFNSQMT